MLEQRLMASPRATRDVFRELYDVAVEATRGGAMYLLQLASVNRRRRHQLRKAFHGPVLRDISEQVWVTQPDGKRVRYTKAAWKEFYRDLFVPPEPQEYTTRDGEIKVRMVKRSTEGLLDDEFAEFLLQVQAHAVTELGVEFEEEKEEVSRWLAD